MVSGIWYPESGIGNLETYTCKRPTRVIYINIKIQKDEIPKITKNTKVYYTNYAYKMLFYYLYKFHNSAFVFFVNSVILYLFFGGTFIFIYTTRVGLLHV